MESLRAMAAEAPSLMMVAGEASGDLHGGNLIRNLSAKRPQVRVRGVGGANMAAAGAEIMFDIRKLSVVGFVEVVRSLERIHRVYRRLCRSLREDPPDALVLIDYPGFNLRLAAFASSLGIPVVYYISPQVWAWGAGRTKRMRQTVDKMIVVFDFEADLYREQGIDVEFVGHPLLDSMDESVPVSEVRSTLCLSEEGPVVGLLPGSRDVEVGAILPAMLRAAELIGRSRPNVQFVIPCAPTVHRGRIQAVADRLGVAVKVFQGRTHDVMRVADLLLVASGTATLEAAIWGAPMVVVYKVSFLTWLAAKSLVRIDNIGLVNVVAGRRIVPELVQYDATPERIAKEALSILGDGARRGEIEAEYQQVRGRLGGPGASERAADAVLGFLDARDLQKG